MRPPTGAQTELVSGALSAVVTEVGATLRCFALDRRPVIWGFPLEEMCSGGRGQLLVPWPNRIGGGRYRFAGRDLQLPIDDQENGCAIHGLARWRPWQVDRLSGAAAACRIVLDPQPGYPFQLELRVTYELTGQELRLRIEATNLGAGAAPFGFGFHPYLHPGAAGLEQASLHVPARQRLELDDRGLPTGTALDLDGSQATRRLDGTAPIAGARLDDCFTGLRVGSDGRWRARLVRAGAGEEPGDTGKVASEIELWADAAFAYCQVYTGDTLAPSDRRLAVAVEPMTCPANAFATGQGVLVLEPGEGFSGELGLRPVC